MKLLMFFDIAGRLWRAADVSSALQSVVYRWSNQLGTRMRPSRFPGSLHSCDVYQELDIHIPSLLMKEELCLQRTEVMLNSHTQILSVHSPDLCDPPVTGAGGSAVLYLN